MTIHFRVLGALDVDKEGRNYTPSAPKLRELLALLLLQSNRIVPTDALAEELWRGEMPRTAQATLQTYIYQLRKMLACDCTRHGREMLVTRPPGYVLQIGRSQLDATQFEDLVQEGRRALDAGDPAAASEVLRRGLALWQGSAVADVDPGPRLSAHITWLEEMRLSALQHRIQADIRLGSYRELVGELRALTALHPLNEWLHQQLMISLHATGRRTEALTVYQSVRRAMREEMGLEPSRDLQETQRALLADQPVGELTASDTRSR